MVYQLQDKIDVAHFLGLEFQDIAYIECSKWNDLRYYSKKAGLKI
jgi:hypothetical protein